MSQDTAAPRQCAGRGWDVAPLEPRGSARPRARRYFKERFPRLMLTTFCFALRHCAREPGLARFFPPAAAEFPFQTPAGAAARAAERDALGARHRPAPTPPLVRRTARRVSSGRDPWLRGKPGHRRLWARLCMPPNCRAFGTPSVACRDGTGTPGALDVRQAVQ